MPSIAETVAATKRAQEKEATEREKTRTAETDGAVDRTAEIDAAEGAGDDALRTEDAGQDRRAAPERTEGTKEPPSKRLTPGDDKRANIFGRFRQDRNTEAADAAEADAEIRELAHQGLPPELVQDEQVEQVEEETGEVQAGAEQIEQQTEREQPQPAPAKVKLKIHGQEVELPLDEVIADAQKYRAADGLLDEARTKAREANELLQTVKGKIAAHPGANQPGQSSQTTEEQTQTEETAVDQGESVTSVVEALQLGNPDEAGKKLDQYITERVKKAEETAVSKSRETLAGERLRDEDTRSQAAQRDFTEKNAELAQNRRFAALLGDELHVQQMADLNKLGVNETSMQEQIGRAPTNDDIAKWHRWYRANGHKVRSAETLLEAARDAVLTDVPSLKPQAVQVDKTTETAPARTEQPKVTVSVNRDVRRTAIRPQPTRTVTPRPAQTAAPKETDRSSIVQNRIALHTARRANNPYRGA